MILFFFFFFFFLFLVLVLVRLERDRYKKAEKHRRAVFKKNNQIKAHFRRLEELEEGLMEETKKLTRTLTELSNLRTVR